MYTLAYRHLFYTLGDFVADLRNFAWRVYKKNRARLPGPAAAAPPPRRRRPDFEATFFRQRPLGNVLEAASLRQRPLGNAFLITNCLKSTHSYRLMPGFMYSIA